MGRRPRTQREQYRVAVVGATGAVGREMVSILAERDFPVRDLVLLASERSAGERLEFGARDVTVRLLRAEAFEGVDLALFSAGAAVSRMYAPQAVQAGAVVVDNTSAFRMEPDVPLVVPEVNREAIRDHHGMIANPNCSTIQMVLVLKPLADRARIRRIVVSTYQSTSGAGRRAMNELLDQTVSLLNQRAVERTVFPHQIAFNCIPHIDLFLEDGSTKEEMKMVQETRKILGDPALRVTATCVRVPTFACHAESVNIEFEEPLSPKEARDILGHAPGITVRDEPAKSLYPLGIAAAGTDPVYVGRIRADTSHDCALNLWIVADNLRKGAALNAVQIAEEVVREEWWGTARRGPA